MTKNTVIDLHHGEFSNRFLGAAIGQKKAIVEARQTTETEHLDTILTNGQAKGRIRVYLNPTGKNVEIIAPWGEKQFGDSQCYFASAVGENLEPTSDRYIIGHDEFEETYAFPRELNFPVPIKNIIERQQESKDEA